MAPVPSARRGRRPSTSAEAIEQAAIALLLTRGFDAVSVTDLARSAGVSRATYFRYFPTKASVVWSGFDRAIDRLELSLRDAPSSTEALLSVRSAIADSVREGVDEHGVWWDRFVLLDSTPSLQGEAAERWGRWTQAISTFIAQRMNLEPMHPRPAAIAAAHQGAYLASLRTWPGRPGDPEQMLQRMLTELEVIGRALSALLAQHLPDSGVSCKARD